MPLFDEEVLLPEPCRRLQAVLDALDECNEVIHAGDGSPDSTHGQRRA